MLRLSPPGRQRFPRSSFFLFDAFISVPRSGARIAPAPGFCGPSKETLVNGKGAALVPPGGLSARAWPGPARSAPSRPARGGWPAPGARSGDAGAGGDGAGDGRADRGGVGEDDHPGPGHRGGGAVGGDPDDLAAGDREAGDELLPVGVLGALVVAVGDDDQDAGGAGGGEVQGSVQGG